jgi:hypothetical protein
MSPPTRLQQTFLSGILCSRAMPTLNSRSAKREPELALLQASQGCGSMQQPTMSMFVPAGWCLPWQDHLPSGMPAM